MAYLPTNPNFSITGIIPDTGKPLQSSAKCPFMLSFACNEETDIESNFMRAESLKNKLGLLW